MIEILETCETKSIAKQTNRDESLIIRSIVQYEYAILPPWTVRWQHWQSLENSQQQFKGLVPMKVHQHPVYT